MPVYDVSIQDKTYHVEIPDPGATPLQVIVDGEAFEVRIQGTEVAAETVTLAPPPPPAPVPTPLPQPVRVELARPTIVGDSPSGADIVAPMPGTILAVNAQAGQQVETGQILLVLEAMKMKNPIRATRPGTVAEIRVQAGESVAYGQMLVRLA